MLRSKAQTNLRTVGGLEVFHKASETWHPVTPVPDAFVVNIGDMMGESDTSLSLSLSTFSSIPNTTSQQKKTRMLIFMLCSAERWTNKRYTSTLHRVISPVASRDRYSVAFFNEGLGSQTIECIPTCLAPGEKPLFAPVTAEQHLKERYGGSY